MRHFFVVGCQRSGTTMLQQALARHSQIIIPPETAFFTHLLGHTRRGQLQHLRRLDRELGIELPKPAHRIHRPDDARRLFEELARLYAEKVGRSDVACSGEKTPHHILRLPRMLRVFPEAKVLLIYRDGRDVALSLTKVPWYSSDLYVCFGYWLRCYRAQQWADRHMGDNLCRLKYEDLVTDPEPHLRRVASFLNLDYEPDMVQATGSAEGIADPNAPWMQRAREQITTTRIGNWRSEMTAEQLQRLERWGESALSNLGYELSTEPTKPLPLHFYPILGWRLFAWRARNGYQVLRRNLSV